MIKLFISHALRYPEFYVSVCLLGYWTSMLAKYSESLTISSPSADGTVDMMWFEQKQWPFARPPPLLPAMFYVTGPYHWFRYTKNSDEFFRWNNSDFCRMYVKLCKDDIV